MSSAAIDASDITIDSAGDAINEAGIADSELVFTDEAPTFFESAPFATTGNAYVMSFGQGETIADPPGSITIDEQVSIS